MRAVISLVLTLLFFVSMGCTTIFTDSQPPDTDLGGSDFEILEYNGQPDEKLDIILVPSHYYGENSGNNPQWIKDAEAFRERLLGHQFWKQYRSKINIYRLDASTADDFFMEGKNYWIPFDERIMKFSMEKAPFIDFEQNDQIIFVIESRGYNSDPLRNPNIGITRGDPNIVKIESFHITALVHEFGHSFGQLGDEYDQAQTIDILQPYPNIASDHEGDTCNDKWGDLMGVVIEAPRTKIENEPHLRTVGCYLANKPDSVGNRYTPTQEGCIMSKIDDSFPFCPVCQRHIVALLNQYTS